MAKKQVPRRARPSSASNNKASPKKPAVANEEDVLQPEEAGGVSLNMQLTEMHAEILNTIKANLKAQTDKLREKYNVALADFNRQQQQYEDIRIELEGIRKTASHPEYNSLHQPELVPGSSMVEEDYHDSSIVPLASTSPECAKRLAANSGSSAGVYGINSGPLEARKVRLLLNFRRARRMVTRKENAMLNVESRLSSIEHSLEMIDQQEEEAEEEAGTS
ncbi:hypothetical protein EV182_000743 [Spiromyces aspiralis]|uniref:Uncharacterized protein n=1 Tax=Spiromyces aspiralis TaxID=68401 RepID=A0ACC1HK38_9FUNG|nr:hypothetical protein EV182_000743 [Spiromyces aspiralis]